jgi:hypothetical protein
MTVLTIRQSRTAPGVNRIARRAALVAVWLTALSAAAPVAQAQGDPYGQVPLYRALVFGGIASNGNDYQAGNFDTIDHASNTAPMPFASMNRSFAANGATMNYTGWAAANAFYTARTYASMSVTNANADDTYYLVAGQGTATSLTFFTPGAQSARATFTFTMSGVESNPSNVGRATSRLDFAASTDTSKTWLDLFDPNGGLNPLLRFGAGTFTYTLPIVPLGQTLNLYFWTSAFTEVLAGSFAQGSNFSMTADYGNTIVLDDVQLYDTTTDALLSNWELKDDLSGDILFDATGRIAEITPIPEPGTWLLMLGGLCVVGWLARLRRPLAPPWQAVSSMTGRTPAVCS